VADAYVPTTTEPPPEAVELGPIQYRVLTQTHPTLDLDFVHVLHSFYRGGRHLLQNPTVMERVFPKYLYEEGQTYAERRKRAFYENLFAMVINQISAGLAQDPCQLTLEDGQDPDPYWAELMDCATTQDDNVRHRRTWDQVLRDICVEGLVTGRSWAQVDLPLASQADYVTKLDQERAGARDAYVIPWSSTHVWDWEEVNGRLLWVKTYDCRRQALTPDQPRGGKLHVYTIWNAAGRAVYEIYEDGKEHKLPNPDDYVAVKKWTPTTFGRVPFVCLDFSGVGSCLHVGDMLESLCRQHFNRANGDAFQWTQYNFQQLYEFLGSEMSGVDTPVASAQANPARARDRRAPGVVHVRGQDDKAMFVGPSMDGASEGRQALQDLRDAIMRVVQQMAMSQDTQGAMIKRSAESKQQDNVATEILLGAIGKILIAFARHLAELICVVRGDTPNDAPPMDGYEKYNVDDADDLIQQTVMLDPVSIPSATYQVEQKFRTAIAHLGDGVSDDVRLKIRKELEASITQDQFDQQNEMDEMQVEQMRAATDQQKAIAAGGGDTKQGKPGEEGDDEPPG
jgi:hypothetical protein